MPLVMMLIASPAAPQTTVRAPASGVSAITGLGASFDGARFGATPVPAAVPPALAINIPVAAAKPIEGSPLSVLLDDSADMTQKTAALAAKSQNEFTQAPAWFDISKVKFDAVIKSGAGGIAVLRYGWRSQYEMSVFAFPGGESISFKEYPASPMGNPKQSFEAALETAAARKAAANILRAAQARSPVHGKDKATLDAILAFLEGA
jgi:hypothetical protein